MFRATIAAVAALFVATSASAGVPIAIGVSVGPQRVYAAPVRVVCLQGIPQYDNWGRLHCVVPPPRPVFYAQPYAARAPGFSEPALPQAYNPGATQEQGGNPNCNGRLVTNGQACMILDTNGNCLGVQWLVPGPAWGPPQDCRRSGY